MKFYIEASWLKIKAYNLTAIFNDHYNVIFYKNGEMHNNKNAAFIEINEYKEFILNGIYYGCEEHFNKKSWRKFVKLKAFL
jgi:hypothetical protein